MNNLCHVCSNPTTMWCSRCHNVWYCSPQHLQEDWPNHRLRCIPATFEDLGTLSGPISADRSLISIAGILLAPHDDRPRIVSIGCRMPSSGEGLCPRPILGAFFPDGYESVVITQGLNGETLRFPIQIFYSPSDLGRNAPVNRAVRYITQGAAEKAWCGPVVALRYNGTRRNAYTDAGTNDISTLSSYFIAYR